MLFVLCKMYRLDPMPNDRKSPVTPSREALLLAAYADIDPRTAERALRGETLKGKSLARVARALEAHPELVRRVA